MIWVGDKNVSDGKYSVWDSLLPSPLRVEPVYLPYNMGNIKRVQKKVEMIGYTEISA